MKFLSMLWMTMMTHHHGNDGEDDSAVDKLESDLNQL